MRHAITVRMQSNAVDAAAAAMANMPLSQSVYKMYKMLAVATLLLRSRPSSSRYVAAAAGAAGASTALSSAELTPASTSRALDDRRCSGGITVRLDEVVCSSCCISASMASCFSWRFFPTKSHTSIVGFKITFWYSRRRTLTGQPQHNRAPPDRPAPADQTEQQAEQLRHTDNAIDDKRADARSWSIVLRKTRHSDAQA